MLPRVLPPRSLQIQPRQLRRCNATEHSLPVYDQRYVPAEVQTGGAQIHFDLLRVPSTDANSGGLNPAFELHTWFRLRICIGINSWNGDPPDASVLRRVDDKRETFGHPPSVLRQPSL